MRVLLAVDNSKFSEAATQAVIAQFRPQETEVRVLHVVEPVAYSGPPRESAPYVPNWEQQVSQAHELVNRAAQALRTAGFKVDTAVIEGGVREGIIDSAAKWRADLIVLGSHGRSGLKRFLLGSVSEAVARHAGCSVEIIRPSTT